MLIEPQRYRVKPGSKVRLEDHDPSQSGGIERADGEKRLAKLQLELADLQYALWAEQKRPVLVVLQAIDAGGKDGTVRHVFGRVNPQGVRVTSFKTPSKEELSHDYLWRVHKVVPSKGTIGIFNRSHYEDVLIVRVENFAPKSVWSRRYEQINHFEELLANASDNGMTILKFFLHISREEQKERLMKRIENPKKHWKFSPDDFQKRAKWDQYMEAYEAVLSKCSTKVAPWHIVPADRKWFRNLVIAETVVDAMKDMKITLPTIDEDPAVWAAMP